MCDVDYLVANFGLPRPLRSRLRPDVRDRETDVRGRTDVRQHIALCPGLLEAGHKNDEVIAENRFRTVASPDACERLAVLN